MAILLRNQSSVRGRHKEIMKVCSLSCAVEVSVSKSREERQSTEAGKALIERVAFELFLEGQVTVHPDGEKKPPQGGGTPHAKS